MRPIERGRNGVVAGRGRGGYLRLAGRSGAVAQMGERCNRTAEVRGSIPLSSTSPDQALSLTPNNSLNRLLKLASV